MRNVFGGPLPVDISKRLAVGDQEAFVLLYHRSQRLIYQTAYSILGSHDDAREICQETFAALWVSRQRFANVADVDKYIHMMSRNIAVRWRDNLRREITYRVKLIDYSPVRAPDVLLETKEFFLLVENAVDRLPPRQRDVFHLLREEMKTHEEISKKLKISQNTVNNHIKKALVTLRQCLIR